MSRLRSFLGLVTCRFGPRLRRRILPAAYGFSLDGKRYLGLSKDNGAPIYTTDYTTEVLNEADGALVDWDKTVYGC